MKRRLGDEPEKRCLPQLLYDRNILIPIKCDVTFGGARYVDSLCWNLFHSVMTPNEFAARTCADLSLPSGFQNRIAMQIAEQVGAYAELVESMHKYVGTSPQWAAKIQEPQVINVGIRHNTMDFSDKFCWNLASADVTPEHFARVTCADLGLPNDMEPVIAHKIRETIFRTICTWTDDPQHTLLVDTSAAASQELTKPSDIKMFMASQYSAIDMITNLWKRAKPNSPEDVASVPQPTMPTDKDSNASVWMRR